MNIQSNILRNLVKLVGPIAIVLLMAGAAMAQSLPKPVGEIASASQTTINGFSAVSGATVFSNNRIRTGKGGAAILNLGKLGRIEFGSETDSTLRLSDEGIGGELQSGKIVLSARAGGIISIKAAKNLITTDGRQASVITILVEGARAGVISHQGEASVVSHGQEGRVTVSRDHMAEWQESSQTLRNMREGGLQRVNPTIAAPVAVRLARTSAQAARSVNATVTPNAPSFNSLFNAGINYSIDPKFNKNAESAEPFETAITCRDGYDHKNRCDKKSKKKPGRD
jgi:hypothetical protein